jgi:rod shape-determining protein MreD
MKWIYVVLLSVLNFILQTTLFEALRINGVAFNTSLILVVFMALVFGNRNALTAAVISGLLQDIFYGWAIGVNVFIYIFLAILIDMVDESVFKDKSMTPFVLMVGATFFYQLMYFGFMAILRVPNEMTLVPLRFLIEVVMNTALGLLIYKSLIKKLMGYELR